MSRINYPRGWESGLCRGKPGISTRLYMASAFWFCTPPFPLWCPDTFSGWHVVEGRSLSKIQLSVYFQSNELECRSWIHNASLCTQIWSVYIYNSGQFFWGDSISWASFSVLHTLFSHILSVYPSFTNWTQNPKRTQRVFGLFLVFWSFTLGKSIFAWKGLWEVGQYLVKGKRSID